MLGQGGRARASCPEYPNKDSKNREEYSKYQSYGFKSITVFFYKNCRCKICVKIVHCHFCPSGEGQFSHSLPSQMSIGKPEGQKLHFSIKLYIKIIRKTTRLQLAGKQKSPAFENCRSGSLCENCP